MKIIGIISEYNPFHTGHLNHIEMTKRICGVDAHIVCVMSGNFMQRGDFAVFNKHARAKAAVLCGADLVIELPVAYALGSAREFAKAGVFILNSLGVCDYISFGSESGDIAVLQNAADVIVSEKAEEKIRFCLGEGLPYAKAQQNAADEILGELSYVFRSPNNILGIEYIKALKRYKSDIIPVTVKRSGGEHDGDAGYSAAAIRKQLGKGLLPCDCMPGASISVCKEEMSLGRGPVFMKDAELAVISRLRSISCFSDFPGATDGLGERFLRMASVAPTIDNLLGDVKTKRFAMSRIRRLMMCAVLGVTDKYINKSPPYIRVLAMNTRGAAVLKAAGKKAELPIITKPASVSKMGKRAVRLFNLESSATDFYSLAYNNVEDRTGGSEWRKSPIVVK